MICLSETAVLDVLDGRLDSTSAPGVEEHLAACAECRQLVSELARTAAATEVAAAHLAPAAVVVGRFRLERRLGVGGMGEVWAARHLVTQRPVAIKLVEVAADERTRLRVAREARTASAVRHPAIVQVFDVLELEDGTPALVMELLAGRSLGARLVADGALSLAETVRVLRPVADALRAAHAEGVIHRDLKPDNVFLCEDDAVKVLDFGIAKDLLVEQEESLQLTRTGELVGTPHYMAPEQVFGERDLDGRTDVWGLGVTMFECLAGRRPFAGATLGQLLRAVSAGNTQPAAARIAGLPPRAARLIDRMMSVDRARRPSMAEVVGELDALAGAKPPAKRTRALVAAATLAMAAAGLGLWRANATTAASGLWRANATTAASGRARANATTAASGLAHANATTAASGLARQASASTVAHRATRTARASPPAPPLRAQGLAVDVTPPPPAPLRELPMRTLQARRAAPTDGPLGRIPPDKAASDRGPGGVIERVPF